MANVIFLSTDYPYACEVCEKFSYDRDMFFVSANDMVEYELSAFNDKVDVDKVSEDTIFRILGYDGCAIAMDLRYLSNENIRRCCFECENTVFLPTDNVDGVYKYAKDEIDEYLREKVKYTVQKDEVSDFIKKWDTQEE